MFGVKRSEVISVVFIVVIIAFVVNMALTLPLSEKTREQERIATCQANLKSCVLAIQMYCNDYDAMLPSSVVAQCPPNISPTQAQVITFMTGKDPWPISRDAYINARSLSWAQLLSAHLENQNSVFCPSDTVPGTRVSYWWKYAVDRSWREMYMRKEGDFVSTHNQIVLYEHSSWHFSDAAGIKNGVKINVGCLDGHAEMVTIKNGPAAYPSAEDERTGLSAIRNGEPMYYNYNVNTNTSATGEATYIDANDYIDVFKGN